MATAQTALKISFKGELHRVRIDLESFSLEALVALFAETFGLAPGSFFLQYTDTEGDCLSVTSQAEYEEACCEFLSGGIDGPKSLRFNATTRASQENVAEPILKAIETLNATMEKFKREQWAEKAQRTAQTSLNHTNEAVKSAASDARESLHAARQAIQEIPFDQLMKETTEGFKCAAEGLSEFAKEVVGERKNKKRPVQTEVSPAPVVQQQPETIAVAEPTAVVTELSAPVTTNDTEWEQVVEHDQPTAIVEETTTDLDAAAPVNTDEVKWSAELSIVRDIFPGVETAVVIDRLEQCNGNVHVVLNALMEM